MYISIMNISLINCLVRERWKFCIVVVDGVIVICRIGLDINGLVCYYVNDCCGWVWIGYEVVCCVDWFIY